MKLMENILSRFASALKYSPFWAAVRVISGTIAALPFIVYRRDGKGGKTRANGHSVYQLLHNRPNEYMDALTFIETRQSHVLTYGNGFAEIQRDNGGRPIALWPLLPDRTFRKISDDGIPYYEVHQRKGPVVPLPDYNVLHIKGLGFDGYTGYNVVSYHKEAIGYGVAVKEFGGRFFSNDASPGGVLTHPSHLGDPALKNLKESWNTEHKGLSRAHRIKILEEGMNWIKTGVDPEQAQALEVQKYTVADCARIFTIPPHKIGDLEHATFSNIEEQNIDFVTATMLYWFRKWELECDYKLFMPGERAKMFCEILVDGLLRNSDKDSVRKAHRDLIASQLLRVARKSFTNFESQRSFAKTILSEPVIAYASTCNRGGMEIRGLLNDSVEELISDKISEDDAGEIAEKIIERIGGNHATT